MAKFSLNITTTNGNFSFSCQGLKDAEEEKVESL